jgi:hypothetical protein
MTPPRSSHNVLRGPLCLTGRDSAVFLYQETSGGAWALLGQLKASEEAAWRSQGTPTQNQHRACPTPTADHVERDWCYLIYAAQNDAVAIGQTRDLLKEVNDAEAATGMPIQLIAAFQSAHAVRVMTTLQERFADHRLTGDWFDSPQIVAYLRSCLQKTIDGWPGGPHSGRPHWSSTTWNL